MLSDFFRINFPYGIGKTKDNKWYFFNREYLPLGITDREFKNSEFFNKNAVSYKNLTVNKVVSIIEKHKPTEIVSKSSVGEGVKFFFYNDATNPSIINNYTAYFKILKDLSKFKIKGLE